MIFYENLILKNSNTWLRFPFPQPQSCRGLLILLYATSTQRSAVRSMRQSKDAGSDLFGAPHVPNAAKGQITFVLTCPGQPDLCVYNIIAVHGPALCVKDVPFLLRRTEGTVLHLERGPVPWGFMVSLDLSSWFSTYRHLRRDTYRRCESLSLARGTAPKSRTRIHRTVLRCGWSVLLVDSDHHHEDMNQKQEYKR